MHVFTFKHNAHGFYRKQVTAFCLVFFQQPEGAMPPMILITTEKYDPHENAVAERINQTLKYEFGLLKTNPTLEIANKML